MRQHCRDEAAAVRLSSKATCACGSVTPWPLRPDCYLKGMCGLLVSVRNPREAESALLGGAALIDVKEPLNGSLGKASSQVIRQVLDFVSERRPVSAAMGELLENPSCLRIRGLKYAKWGLAGCGPERNWRDRFLAMRDRLGESMPGCKLVAVVYADWHLAGAPSAEEICDFACKRGFPALLMDTWRKNGKTLLDWLTIGEIAELVDRCRAAGVKVALAGGLGADQIRLLHAIQPDWFAVRSAVCRGGIREDLIETAAVRKLVELLDSLSRPPIAKVDNAYV